MKYAEEIKQRVRNEWLPICSALIPPRQFDKQVERLLLLAKACEVRKRAASKAEK